MGCAYFVRLKLSILGDIFDKDTCSSLGTSLDLYLVIIFVSAENAVLYKYFVVKSSDKMDNINL